MKRGHRRDVPRPYSGQELDRRDHLGKPFAKSGYGSDQDAGRTYRFNALGFRGPEFDPAARHRIYAFGESHAFGYFVDAEQCWPARFAALWSEARGLAPSDVCFQNFADVGASNSSIARSLITQCSAAPPDLVLVHFSEPHRSDVYLHGQPHRIGPWLLDEETARAAPEDGPLRAAYLSQIERAHHFYRYAQGSDELNLEAFDLTKDATYIEDTLRNILLVQFFCQARGLPAIATCDRIDSLFNDGVREHASLGPLLAQIDRKFLPRVRIWTLYGGQTEDDGHADPRRHDRFARVLLRLCDESRPQQKPSPPLEIADESER